MPKLTHTLKVINPKTKVENEVVIEGLASFFNQPWLMKVWKIIIEQTLH